MNSTVPEMTKEEIREGCKQLYEELLRMEKSGELQKFFEMNKQ